MSSHDGQAVLRVFPAAFAEKIVHHGSDVLDLRQAARRANAGDARWPSQCRMMKPARWPCDAESTDFVG